MHGRLLAGELYWGDAGIYFYPMWEFVRRCLLQGELPFWNPYVNGGQPLIGNPQMGVFYPTTLLLLFVPTARWLSLVVALHLLWSGFGMRLWLRVLGCSPAASVWGACAWMGCTAVVARAQFPPFLMSIAWYPWVLWGIERVWQQPTVRNALWLALVGALCILASHPQSAYLMGVCALLYTLLRWWSNGSETGATDPSPLPRFGALGLALGLVLGLSALYWLPASVVGSFSHYSQMSLWEADRFRWTIRHWAGLIYPFVWGNPMGLYVAHGNYWETTTFIGTLPLLLVPFAFERNVRLHWGLGAIALITAWLAMGTRGGLYTLAFYALPGMRLFHDPARWLLITCLMLAALSALGYDRLSRGLWHPVQQLEAFRAIGQVQRTVGRWVLIVGAVLCLLLVLLPLTRGGSAWQRAFLTSRASEDYPQPHADQMLQVAQRGWQHGAIWLGASLVLLLVAMRWRQAHAVPLWIGFLPMQLYAVHCSLPIAPLGSWAQAQRVLKAEAKSGRWWYPQTYQGWRRHISYLTYADTSPTEMVQVGIPNLPMLLPTSVWGAYEPLVPQRVSRLERIIRFSHPDRQARWLKALGIEWHVRLIEGKAHFERLAPPCPSVQLVPRAFPVQDFDAMLKRFRRQPYDPCEQVLVEGLPSELLAGGGRVLKVQRRNAFLRIQVECPQPSVLVVRETLLPGWRAWVDGKPVPLFYAEGVLRAVVIPSGKHEVEMRYRPQLWEIGLIFSILSGLVALMICFIPPKKFGGICR